MPPEVKSVETRLNEVEAELRRLKRLFPEDVSANGMPWWKRLVGSHEGDAVFAEIVTLGRAIRQGQATHRKRRKKLTRAAARPRKTQG